MDRYSDLNYSIVNKSPDAKYPCYIIDSKCSIKLINEGCKISESRCYGTIILGRFVTITGPGTILKSLKDKIEIGSFSSIGQNVCIVDFNHIFERLTSCFINHLVFHDDFGKDIQTKGPVIIGEDVWIGSNSVILAGVNIGRGSIIGAGSIVTKDIPPYSIVYGNPAKIQSKRFDDKTIDFLEKLEWWNWDTSKLLENKKIFNQNADLINFIDLTT
ncbi:MAG: CatB-related O-acetyltransferase [Salinivirgaceae bacterium]